MPDIGKRSKWIKIPASSSRKNARHACPDFPLSLQPHPLTPAPMVRSLDAAITRTAHGLSITYRLYGDMARLLIPVGGAGERCDNLWEHTCFELFIACTGSTAYREFNFSPAGQWAAYDFTDYRSPHDHTRRPARSAHCRPALRRTTRNDTDFLKKEKENRKKN